MPERLGNVNGSPVDPDEEMTEEELLAAATQGVGFVGTNPGGFGIGATAPGTNEAIEQATGIDVVGTDGDGNKYSNDRTPETPIEAYERMLNEAYARRDKEVGELEGDLAGLEDLAGSSDQADQEALAAYLEQMGGFDQLEAAGYVGDATADQRGIDAQLDAMGRFKELSNTGVTAEERFMYEQQRMAEERDRAAAMDAALRDLESRGARSGGAEIAALTGAQDITSQNRLLGDLGTQANAQQRAMLALQGYGDTAGQIRDSSFRESGFNKKLMSDWNMWSDDFKQGERDRAVDRAGMERAAKNDTTDRGFGRAGMIYNEKEDATGLRLGNEAARTSGAGDYTRLLMGKESSDAAAAALEEEDDWSIGDPILLDKILDF
jgi:hypothetical protein